MPKIRVWNKNTLPYTETFDDKEIKILPGKSVDMEADDAIRFMGTYKAPEYDGMGVQTRESYKMLEREHIEPLFDDGSGNFGMKAGNLDDFKCIVCGKQCVDQEHLDGHVNANHVDDMADKSEQAKRMKSMNKNKR